ncbi:MAG: hypothetical protein OXM59_00110, partial [Gammaproteobacteria bacterium]|nr:hypothetical protein [Gammaproteobacteria bacterium]
PSGPPLRPYFPPVQQAPRSNRTPLEAFREGQEAGVAIGNMLVGFRDRHKRKRRDAIVQRHFAGTISREDYVQLAQDGYTDLALQLAQASPAPAVTPPPAYDVEELIALFEREAPDNVPAEDIKAVALIARWKANGIAESAIREHYPHTAEQMHAARILLGEVD